ncbi:hypothetical protein, conserved [Eimeria tenella]|uniref:Uncharacterized protein n=1 Tax=Eimeria tenella TaxID=5802 RepID=U6KUH6_EIMTE|nr:hypothetical protein, conserved [Eimeria tenella]CDJ40568.1 hypothetical protein, conserved [Eimeria tenella]|eukprot:XP_013231318.1 hypothetical protein, conserved [Eimeria tenella]
MQRIQTFLGDMALCRASSRGPATTLRTGLAFVECARCRPQCTGSLCPSPQAFPGVFLRQSRITVRAVSGAVDRQPNLQSTSSASVHAFSAIKGARRDSSNKWLKAAQAVAGVDLEDNVGFAEGSAVRGRSILEIWRQQLQQQLGGEQKLLHDLLKETRASALQRLAEAAALAGANAVVSVRLVTSGLQSMHVEYTAYGTAVKVAKPSPLSAS